MTDNLCMNCGSDNLTDYPVCPTCSHRVHFSYRTPCLHCVRQNIEARIQDDDAPELDVSAIREFAEARGLDTTLLEEYVNHRRSQMRQRVICHTCNDEGIIWAEGSPTFDNPAGDYQVPCECRQVRRDFYGDEFFGITQDIPF